METVAREATVQEIFCLSSEKTRLSRGKVQRKAEWTLQTLSPLAENLQSVPIPLYMITVDQLLEVGKSYPVCITVECAKSKPVYHYLKSMETPTD